jgi:hypothetical protein
MVKRRCVTASSARASRSWRAPPASRTLPLRSIRDGMLGVDRALPRSPRRDDSRHFVTYPLARFAALDPGHQ